MAGSVRDVFGTLKLKDEATKPLEKMDKGMDEAKESVLDVQGALLALGGVAVLAAVKSLATEFIMTFAVLETQQTRLQNLAGNDFPALSGSINEAIEASKGLSNEGDLSTAVNQAIKYGASVDLITGSLSSLQKLSAITGDDLASTMQGLAKDVATGSTRFIQQNPLLVKHIDQFKKIGAGYDDASKKRRELLILDVLQKESIAIQEQYNNTLEDTNALLAISESQWGNIKERMGSMLVEGLKPILQIGNAFLIWLGESEEGLALLRFALIAITPLIGVALVFALKTAAVFAWAFMAPFLPFIAIALAVGVAVALLAFFIQDLIVWFQGGVSALGAFFDKIKEVFSYIGYLLGGGLAETLFGLLGFGGDVNVSAGQESAQGSRAGGGSVGAGRPYIVGEEGAEMFVPSQSGEIVPIGGGGGNSVSISVGPFYVNGSEETAREVETAVLDALNSLSNNIFRQETGVPIFG